MDLTDSAVLGRLGRRIARVRLDRNVTQRQLAAEAGVSLPTLQRLEGGRGATLRALARVLRALDLLDRLEALVPQQLPDPIEQRERAGRQRRRAAGAHSKRRQEQSHGWSPPATAASRRAPGPATDASRAAPAPETAPPRTAPAPATAAPRAAPALATTTGRVLPPRPE